MIVVAVTKENGCYRFQVYETEKPPKLYVKDLRAEGWSRDLDRATREARAQIVNIMGVGDGDGNNEV